MNRAHDDDDDDDRLVNGGTIDPKSTMNPLVSFLACFSFQMCSIYSDGRWRTMDTFQVRTIERLTRGQANTNTLSWHTHQFVRFVTEQKVGCFVVLDISVERRLLVSVTLPCLSFLLHSLNLCFIQQSKKKEQQHKTQFCEPAWLFVGLFVCPTQKELFLCLCQCGDRDAYPTTKQDSNSAS